ncbi:MAG: hypothetical protein IH609_05270 [Dehalococcoidia bacterium]|nr:hypothetical protein [Dehalococcoidia bacterium]
MTLAARPGTTFAYRAAPGRFSRRRWLAYVTAGEALGFMVPGLTWFAAWKLGLPALPLAVVVVLAGAGEGAVLGWSQWRVLRDWQPAITATWVRLTTLAAAASWALGMAPSTAYDLGAPTWVAIAVGVAGAPFLLMTIGTAQWFVLREFVPRAWRWIAVNAAAWFIALPPTFIGPALVPADAPVALDLAVWGVSGLLMAALLAAVTGAAMARLVREVS